LYYPESSQYFIVRCMLCMQLVKVLAHTSSLGACCVCNLYATYVVKWGELFVAEYMLLPSTFFKKLSF
jgi:hypothetical protein